MRGATSVDPSRAASGRPGGRRCATLGRALETVLLTAGATAGGPHADSRSCPEMPVALRSRAVAATPAVRVLEQASVPHTLHPYDAGQPADRATARPPRPRSAPTPGRCSRPWSTRVDGALTVAVVPVSGSLDLKALAAAAGGPQGGHGRARGRRAGDRLRARRDQPAGPAQARCPPSSTSRRWGSRRSWSAPAGAACRWSCRRPSWSGSPARGPPRSRAEACGQGRP